MTSKELLYNIKKVCIDIHKQYGPGLLEKTYHELLKFRLQDNGYVVTSELSLDLIEGNHVIRNAYRIDMLINDILIVEIKAVPKILPVHHKQLMTYMRLSNKPLGLLVNFYCADLFEEGLRSWDYTQTSLNSFLVE